MTSMKDFMEMMKEERQIGINDFYDNYSLNQFNNTKKETYPNISDKNLINNLMDAKLITFVQKYICGTDIPFDKYVDHEKIPQLTFKYFKREELMELLDTCYNDICGNVCVILNGESVYPLEKEEKNIENNINNDRNNKYNKTKNISDLKAFIFILDLIRIKEKDISRQEFAMLEEYIDKLKEKYNALYDTYRFKNEVKKMISELKLEIVPSSNRSIAFLEVEQAKIKNNPIVIKMVTYLKQELCIPVVVIPKTMKLEIVNEDNVEDSSIEGLEL